MTLCFLRRVDGVLLAYDVEVPRRGLVDIMRIENLKPGDIISYRPVTA